MTKEEALAKTKEKFTNLLDGDILPGVSVGEIISYYESQLDNGSLSLDGHCLWMV